MEQTAHTTPSPASPASATLVHRLRALVSFDRREQLALAVLAALVLLGATVAYARARPAVAASMQPITGAVAPTPEVESAARLIVHVVGAVQRPGVYDFAEGARVVDAVDAAGGFARTADRAAVNLARALVDGEQIVIPRRGQVPAPTAASSGGGDAGGKVNINTASAAELEELPGIGPVLAQRIVDHREQHGPFRSVADLQKVSGIGPKTFASLEPLVTV